MVISVLKEEGKVYISYPCLDEEMKGEFNYDTIEKLIDYIMDNDIKDIEVSGDEECKQFVDLLKLVTDKTKSEDFINCYKKAKDDASKESEARLDGEPSSSNN